MLIRGVVEQIVRRIVTPCSLFLLAIAGCPTIAAPPGGQGRPERFLRGDANVDGVIGLEDALTVASHLFLANPVKLECEDAADISGDEALNIGDVLWCLFFLFEGGDSPAPPYPSCGEDPMDDPISPVGDMLRCNSYWICGTGTLENSIGMTLIPVHPGGFEMGSPTTERGRSIDEILHGVVLTCGFYMGETEVTQAQYLEIMGENPSAANGGIFGILLTRPVDNVSWFDAIEFCRRLSLKENRKYRLPYEAEWEYACRAGTNTRFWFGDALDCNDLCPCPCPTVAPFMFTYGDGSGGGYQLPVKLLEPNAWGFYDIHGHVAELCQDWYGAYPRTLVVDPTGPRNGSHKVVRGNWDIDGLTLMRSATRFRIPPEIAATPYGFRVVVELPNCPYPDPYRE